MLLETITFLPVFCLKSLVCWWSDFEIGSYSLLFYKYMYDTYIDTFVCICIYMSVILSVFILGSVVDFIQTNGIITQYADDTSKFWMFVYMQHSTVAQ